MCVMRAQTNVISATVCLAVGALVRNLSLANLVASLALLYALLLCGCVREHLHRCTVVGHCASTRAVGVVKKQPRGRELVGVGARRGTWGSDRTSCPSRVRLRVLLLQAAEPQRRHGVRDEHVPEGVVHELRV